jgi:hypothetical protein
VKVGHEVWVQANTWPNAQKQAKQRVLKTEQKSEVELTSTLLISTNYLKKRAKDHIYWRWNLNLSQMEPSNIQAVGQGNK